MPQFIVCIRYGSAVHCKRKFGAVRASECSTFGPTGLTIRSSIFAKFLLTSVLLISVALATADFLLSRSTAQRERALAQQQMADSLRLLAPAFLSNSPKDRQKWAQDIDAAVHARLTIIDQTGVVLADSRHDPETMENHLQ